MNWMCNPRGEYELVTLSKYKLLTHNDWLALVFRVFNGERIWSTKEAILPFSVSLCGFHYTFTDSFAYDWYIVYDAGENKLLICPYGLLNYASKRTLQINITVNKVSSMSKTTLLSSELEISNDLRRAYLNAYRIDKVIETLFGILRDYQQQVEVWAVICDCYLTGGKKWKRCSVLFWGFEIKSGWPWIGEEVVLIYSRWWFSHRN